MHTPLDDSRRGRPADRPARRGRAPALVSSLLTALALVACGGGGGGGGSAAVGGSGGGSGGGGSAGSSGVGSVTTSRVARMLYDFDNNGTAEGVLVLSYDALGRLTQEAYTYTGDGTPDADFDTFCLVCIGGVDDTTSGTIRYAYDTQGRLATITTQSSGGSANVVTFTRGTDGRVLQADLGGATAALTYTGDRLTGVTLSSGTTLINTYALAYDAAGQVSTDTLVTQPPGTPNVRSYTWNAAGFMSMIDESQGASFHQVLTFSYDSANRPVRRTQDDQTGTDDYSWTFLYAPDRRMEVDLGDDGSVEAVVRVEVESGSCAPVTAWFPRAEPNFAQPGLDAWRPGTGHVNLPYCVP